MVTTAMSRSPVLNAGVTKARHMRYLRFVADLGETCPSVR